MGSFFSNCIKGNNTGKSDPPHDGNQKKSRVNDTDKAVLDVKARMRKIKTYTDKMNLQVNQQKAKIQEHLKDKNKSRALIALKHKKFLEKELDKAYGAQNMLQQTIANIESAQADVEIYQALKTGDQVLTDLQQKASLEDFEELYEKHQEHLEKQKMEQELFGEVLKDDELEDELAALDAQIIDEQIPDAPTEPIKANPQQQKQPEKEQQKKVSSDKGKQQPILA